jgi:signal transduction histidine kinase
VTFLRSLRFRLLAGGLVATLVALMLAGFAIVLLFERHLERRANEEAESFLRLLIGRLTVDPAGKVLVDLDGADPRFGEPYGGLYWQVNEGRVAVSRSRSLWDFRLNLPDDTLAQALTHHHTIAGPDDQQVLVVERTVLLGPTPNARSFRAVIALDRASIDRARSDYAFDVMLALAALGGSLFLAFAVQVTIGLRPLRQLASGVERVSSGAARRLSDEGPSEVAPLVGELNRLLDRRDRMIERARGRAADLAHGLKTPLTALDGDVRRLVDLGQPEIAAEIGQLGAMMKAHVKRELARARIIGAEEARDLSSMARARASIETIAATVARTPDGQRIAFEIDCDEELVLPMDRLDLDEALGNLIENAARHGRSWVLVRVWHDGRRFEVCVEDDGPGVDPSLMERLTQRGRSGSMPAREDVGGLGSAGLGLSIVADIVEAYGGDLSFARSAQGGLAVRVALPVR